MKEKQQQQNIKLKLMDFGTFWYVFNIIAEEKYVEHSFIVQTRVCLDCGDILQS